MIFQAPSVTLEVVPNLWKGRNGKKVVAIVDHITQGSRGSVINHFQNPGTEVSAHFMVCKTGEVVNFVNVADTAWGNGIPNKPDMSIGWLADCLNAGSNPNFFTVSIEHEGDTGVALSEPQYQSTLMLHLYLIQTFSITIDRDHIIGHYRIDSVNRANCPGSAFPWQRLLNDLTAKIAAASAPPPVKVWHCTTAGHIFDVSDAHGILSHYQNFGGIITFGYPESKEFLCTFEKDEQGNPMYAQVFERGILAYHPKDNSPWNVQGLLVRDPNWAEVINQARSIGGMSIPTY